MIFATFWMCNCVCWKTQIDKYSSQPLAKNHAKHWQIVDRGNWNWKKNIFHRRLTRLLRQPVKRDINGFWKSPTTSRQIVGVVAFFHSFFMHIQSFSLSHLNECLWYSPTQSGLAQCHLLFVTMASFRTGWLLSCCMVEMMDWTDSYRWAWSFFSADLYLAMGSSFYSAMIITVSLS